MSTDLTRLIAHPLDHSLFTGKHSHAPGNLKGAVDLVIDGEPAAGHIHDDEKSVVASLSYGVPYGA